MNTFLLEKLRLSVRTLYNEIREFAKELYSDLVKNELKNFDYNILDTEMYIYNPVEKYNRDIKISIVDLHIKITIDDNDLDVSDIDYRVYFLLNFISDYDTCFDNMKKDILKVIEKWNTEDGQC